VQAIVDTTPSADRRSQQRGLLTRQALIDAALHEFAAYGFEAASTRTIAARAGVRQGQLTYHFDSKDVLWRATVDDLFARFDVEFGAALEPGAGGDPVSLFAQGIRALVRAVSRLPELNRIMVHEATADSERLTWIVDAHVRARFEQLGEQWRDIRARRATSLDVDPIIIYYTLLGAASLLYVNASEARRLLGRATIDDVVTDALIDEHAETLVAMLLGPSALG
jgi:TetR/AcrR family transcriptional regulator